MVPLFVMIGAWLVFRGLGVFGVIAAASSWVGALRFGLAVMFLFTAVSHFVPKTRRDLIRMVPPRFQNPLLLVTMTGLLEAAGAVGLLVPTLRPLAAWCLIALLAAMLPANVHAARAGLLIAGRPATPLRIRVPLQLAWAGALLWVTSSASR